MVWSLKLSKQQYQSRRAESEQVGSSSCQGSTGKEQKDARQQLGPAWESYLFLWDSLRR